MRFPRFAIVMLVCAACGADAPIRWDPAVRVPGAIMPGARMVLTSEGVPAVQAALQPFRWPEDSLACTATRIAVQAGSTAQVAAWWRSSRRVAGAPQAPDTLLVARTPDGVIWGTPVPMAAAAERACRSAPAGLVVDAIAGTAYVGFHGLVSGQPGVGLAWLERGAAAISGAVLVAAGRLPRLVAIAVRGDTVALAYEASGPSGGDIRLAISGRKSQFPVDCGSVADGSARAFAPVIALANGRVAVGWNEARRGDRMPAAVARAGEIRRACEPSR